MVKKYNNRTEDLHLLEISSHITEIKNDIKNDRKNNEKTSEYIIKKIDEITELICPKDTEKGILNILTKLKFQVKWLWAFLVFIIISILKDWILLILR